MFYAALGGMLLRAYHFADFKKKIPATSVRRPKESKTTVAQPLEGLPKQHPLLGH